MGGTGGLHGTGGVSGAGTPGGTGIGGATGAERGYGVGGGSTDRSYGAGSATGTERSYGTGGATGGTSGAGTTGWGEGEQSGEHGGHERVSHAMEKTSDLVHRAGDVARHGLEDGKNRAAHELHYVADALRTGVQQSSHRNAAFAPYLERVAEQVDRWSDMVENRSVNDIMRNVEDFARERPALFLGGCFALGVAAARFLKANEPSHERMGPRGDFGYESNRGISSGYRTGSGAELGYGTRGVGDTGESWRSSSAGHTYEADRSR